MCLMFKELITYILLNNVSLVLHLVTSNKNMYQIINKIYASKTCPNNVSTNKFCIESFDNLLTVYNLWYVFVTTNKTCILNIEIKQKFC